MRDENQHKLNSAQKKEIMQDYRGLMSRLIVKIGPSLVEMFEGSESAIILMDMLIALPISFDIDEYDYSKISQNDNGYKPSMAEMAIGGFIKIDKENELAPLMVNIIFNKDISQSWEEFFTWIRKDKACMQQLAFAYLHEAEHLLLKHHSFYMQQRSNRIIQEINPEITKDQRHLIINSSYDYFINGFTIEEANSRSIIGGYRNGDCPFLYDSELSPSKMSQDEILETVALEAKITQEENILGTVTTVEFRGNTSNFFTPNEQHLTGSTTAESISQERLVDITQAMESASGTLLDKTRGTSSAGIFGKLGVNYEVPIDWIDVLSGSILNTIQRYSDTSYPTWSKAKMAYRHIAYLPGRIYQENKIACVISIDQSGSMSDDDLKKINFVVDIIAKKSEFVRVLLHDTSVKSEKTFKKGASNLTSSLSNFIQNRVAYGGTSHKEVFKMLDETKKLHPKIHIIYLSFSDNYSDIEQVYDTEIFKDVSSYWITTDENKPALVPGLQISLEGGVL